MAFELQIAVKQEPIERRNVGEASNAARASHATVSLRGFFHVATVDDVLRTVADLFREGAESVIVEMQDVRIDDAVCVQGFAAELMALRSSGKHVQVLARQAPAHAALSQASSSRDWLISFTETDICGGRRGVHVHRPAEDT